MLENARATIPTIRKALAAAAAACTITAAALADAAISLDEGFMVAAAWLAVFGVYTATNDGGDNEADAETGA